MATKNPTIAITGTSCPFGKTLLSFLKKNSGAKKIVVLNIDRTESVSVDLIGDLLLKNNCRTLIDASLPDPSPKAESLHEEIATGTMHLLLAAEKAKVEKLIYLGTSKVYGALPDNPTFIEENDPARGGIHSAYLKDIIDAEKQYLRYQKRFPERCVTILRFAEIAGLDPAGSIFADKSVVTILGFDPPVQLLHISDALESVIATLKKDCRGVFNIAADGVLPISRAARLAGKVEAPVASCILYPAAGMLWHMNISGSPAGHLDFLKYPCVIDNKRAKKIMGFRPKITSQEALKNYNEKKKTG